MPDSIKCDKCDQEFTDEEAHKIHMNIDHGASEADSFQFTDSKNAVDEQEFVGVNAVRGYNPNPNSDFYNNKIFRKGHSTEIPSQLGESKANEAPFVWDPFNKGIERKWVCPDCGKDIPIIYSIDSPETYIPIKDHMKKEHRYTDSQAENVLEIDYHSDHAHKDNQYGKGNQGKQYYNGKWYGESFSGEAGGIPSELLEDIHDEEIRKSGHPENWSIGKPRLKGVTKEYSFGESYANEDYDLLRLRIRDEIRRMEKEDKKKDASEGLYEDYIQMFPEDEWRTGGGFGQALKDNDLVKAYRRADLGNRDRLEKITGNSRYELERIAYESYANEDAINPDAELDIMSTPWDEQQGRFRNERDEQSPLDNIYSESDVDYEKEDKQSMGFIEQQHTEPKEDKNKELDDVDISEESIDYVYPTKASESRKKSYTTEAKMIEGLEEEYDDFEDSDEEMIEETITLRKLGGYSEESIAKELHITYGVSHDEALEKVYSVEVSNNDKVAQTFFGKMYKECTESEKAELRMYGGSN
jgi:hypothetical protein